MATSFDTIYAQFENRTDDRTLSSYDNLYYYEMSQRLMYGISEFTSDCETDLTERTDFSQNIYQFTGDGLTVNYTLSPVPDSSGTFYVTVGGVETSDYTYLAGVLTFDTAPSLGSAIYISNYVIGEFTNDLSKAEISILAEAIKLVMTSNEIYSTKQLNQMVYGNSVGLHSQANHNKVNLSIDDTLYKRWKQRICEYSYSDDPDDLEGLVGTPTYDS